METLCCRRYSRAPRSCSRACSPRLYRWCIVCVRECVRGVVSRHATAIPSIKKRIEEKRKLVFRGRIYRFDIRAKFIYLFFLLLSIIDLRRFFVRLHADAILFVGIRVVRIRGIEERVDFRSVFRLARLITISKRTRLRKCTPHRFPDTSVLCSRAYQPAAISYFMQRPSIIRVNLTTAVPSAYTASDRSAPSIVSRGILAA